MAHVSAALLLWDTTPDSLIVSKINTGCKFEPTVTRCNYTGFCCCCCCFGYSYSSNEPS